MSCLDFVGVTPAQLRDIADEVERRWPGSILVKNQVGNLSIVLVGKDSEDEPTGTWLGWADLRFGGIHAEEDRDDEAEGAHP